MRYFHDLAPLRTRSGTRAGASLAVRVAGEPDQGACQRQQQDSARSGQRPGRVAFWTAPPLAGMWLSVFNWDSFPFHDGVG